MSNTPMPPVQITLEVVGGKWKPAILWELEEGSKRFSELARCIEGITQKMLTQQLRELEKDGLIIRTVYPQIPPKVEYKMSEYGKTLKPVLVSMCEWGKKHKERK